ncbi:MAG TPA: helix-turn-helix domain-containing protein [Rhodococcus sp. (in: high G+C Gram-positive bacteria)]|uniref:TetR/AcrR family transcriptional regulator n=1 Tax=Rhodococcus sp. SJ-3 TaxID=3454628 RepID=UPI002D8D0737|nr:helix-turn-helix domain-containing protein [Rhodococcus sp. (in: high G+C Gram-positive bacteria)]
MPAEQPPTAVSPPAIGATNPPEIESILDAAEAQFSEVGVRLTTVNDIARRAGVGRVTVYRRIGSRDEIAQAVTARSAARLIDEVVATAQAAGTIDDLVGDVFATTVTRMREHPVWNRMLSLETDSALPRLTTQGGTLLTTATHAAVAILDDAVASGLLPPVDDLVGRAEVVVRVAHSVVLTPQALVPLQTREDLASFARERLLPILAPHRP